MINCKYLAVSLVFHWQDYFATAHNLTPDKIYHVTVMPCFDKKLEASRPDFYSDLYSTRDVDCVITSGTVKLFNLNLFI